MLGKFDDKIKEHLRDAAVEDEVPLYSTETFFPEFGVTYDDGDGIGAGAGDFDDAKHAWAVWNEGEMEDDDEKMKSAALFIMSKHGSPSEFAANKAQIKTILKALLGYGLRTCEFALITYDAPYVQDALVPYLQRKSETKTIVLAGPSATQKSAFAKALFGESTISSRVWMR